MVLALIASFTLAGGAAAADRADETGEADRDLNTVFSAAYMTSVHSDRNIDTLLLDAAVGFLSWERLELFGQMTLVRNTGYSTDDWNPDLGRMDEDSVGAGAGIMARFHLLKSGRIGLFAEGSIGGVVYDKQYPTGGTHWNIMSRLGGSLSYSLSERAVLELGYRYMHISNGMMDTPDRNPAVDSQGVTLGLQYRF
jgi:opacity protein-like surface antigen